MPFGIYLSAAGAHVQNHRLEVLSHNIANINTPGFKQSFAVLQSRHNKAIENGNAYPGSGTLADIGGGVEIQPTVTSFAHGPMDRTEKKTDFAINDTESFFVVRRGDEQLLTRSGGFMFNNAGVLTNTNGDQVVGADGGPIQIDPTTRYEVNDDGVIQQAGANLSLMVVRPNNAGDLTRVGDNLFKSLSEVQPVPPNQRAVVSGFLEKSAVNPTLAMMELIEASRAYESNLRLIQHQDQAYGNLIGRVLGN
ncbi:MAG: flagellar hook-basal body protein [Pirellula sp.]|jgi:flagellar basal-body rod protein FlgF/flagellar basal-body rod protein FlgG|nr:flagellar hook-basal body protein [Pirellula sp.]